VAGIHTARGCVISFLYAHEFGETDMEELKKDIFEHRRVKEKYIKFAEETFSGVLSNLEFIDSVIHEKLNGRNFDELGHVETAILRLGVFEIKFQKTDKGIAINEALQLVRDFGVEPATKLINAILDSITE
jgi:N utilization substance protein B